MNELYIYQFYRKLTIDRVAKYLGFRTVINWYLILFVLLFLIIIILGYINMFQYFSTFLRENEHITYYIMVSCVIAIGAILIKLPCYSFIYIINNDNKVFDIDKYREKAMYLFLIKERYIMLEKNNAYFYSAVIDFINTKIYRNDMNVTSLITIILFIFTFLSFIFGDMKELGGRILVVNIVILLSSLIIGYVFLCKLTDRNGKRWNKLYSIFLNLRLKDAAGKSEI